MLSKAPLPRKHPMVVAKNSDKRGISRITLAPNDVPAYLIAGRWQAK